MSKKLKKLLDQVHDVLRIKILVSYRIELDGLDQKIYSVQSEKPPISYSANPDFS